MHDDEKQEIQNTSKYYYKILKNNNNRVEQNITSTAGVLTYFMRHARRDEITESQIFD
jgi:hypothetical protein